MMYIPAVSGFIGICIIGIFALIRFNKLSALSGFLITVFLTFVGMIVVDLIKGPDKLEFICIGTLLAVSFGVPTFVIGRILENRNSK